MVRIATITKSKSISFDYPERVGERVNSYEYFESIAIMFHFE